MENDRQQEDEFNDWHIISLDEYSPGQTLIELQPLLSSNQSSSHDNSNNKNHSDNESEDESIIESLSPSSQFINLEILWGMNQYLVND